MMNKMDFKITEKTTLKEIINVINNYLNEQNKIDIVDPYNFMFGTIFELFGGYAISVKKGLREFTIYNKYTFKLRSGKNNLGITWNPTQSHDQIKYTAKSVDNINKYDLNIMIGEIKSEYNKSKQQNNIQTEIDKFKNFILSKNISLKDAESIIKEYKHLSSDVAAKVFE